MLSLGRCFIFLSVILLSNIDASAVKLTINIGNEETFYLQSQTFIHAGFVNRKTLVDSTFSDNLVVFDLDSSLPNGLYSVMIYTDMKDDLEGKFQRVGFDMILNGKNLEFTIEVTPEHTLGAVMAKEGENFGYYNHFNRSFNQTRRLNILENTLAEYPKGDDDFISVLEKKIEEIKKDQENLSGTIEGYPIADYYFQMQKKIGNPFIEEIDFNNTWLKNSQMIPAIVWRYLDDAETDQFSLGTPEEKLFNRLKKLFAKLQNSDKEVFEMVLTEVIEHYEKVGKHEAVILLNEQFLLPEVCANEEFADRILAKNEALKKLAIGQVAPNIYFDPNGAVKNLNEVVADYTVLLFWETECPHCQDLTEELSKFYNQRLNDGIAIVAVALDTSEIDYYRYVNPKDFKWLDVTDFSGWRGEKAKLYHVVSTPNMILLDKNKIILAKPRSVREIADYIDLRN